MKKRVVILATLILAAVLVTGVLAGEPTGLPVEYQVLSPLTVGAMRYWPNERPDEVWHDVVRNGSFEFINPRDWWSWHPEETQLYNVGRDAAKDGLHVVIQGITGEFEQLMQCWAPGALDGYLGFELWVSYRYTSNEPAWIQCSWSHALFIEWDEATQLWYRISPDLWYLMNWSTTPDWTYIQDYLPGLENFDDSLVCLLVEGQGCGYNTEFWYDQFMLLAHPVVSEVYVPGVMKNYSYMMSLAAVNQVVSVQSTVRQ